jgi:2-polyprenyl-6-methoxyphenol hydroxylase-like FAD-dependent oxidoreductase
MSKSPSVLIVGGGIGGLCLAHGLVQAGIGVQVAERTHARTDWLQGYRIHIGPGGSRALHACLPAAAWARFCATVSDEAATFSFRTEQLAPLLVVTTERADDPAEQHHGISRIALREVLLDGLDDVVTFGRVFDRYEILADGRVRAHFADGTTAEADLLVGADGANSRVRGQLLPHARRLDTGVLAIAGKHPLTGDDGLPSELLAGPTTVLPPGPGGMFTAVWRGDRTRAAGSQQGHLPATGSQQGDIPEIEWQQCRRPAAPTPPPGVLFDTTTDYVFWAYANAANVFPPLDGRCGPELTEVVLREIATWSPGLQQLVAGSAPETVNALRVRSAEPVTAWPTGPVTLLGDAIHNMTPMAGIGANTALRDADLLRRNLITAGTDLTAAVADYERRMLDYGFAAVARSLRNARFAASGHPVTRRAMRGALRAVNLVPPMKRRML